MNNRDELTAIANELGEISDALVSTNMIRSRQLTVLAQRVAACRPPAPEQLPERCPKCGNKDYMCADCPTPRRQVRQANG